MRPVSVTVSSQSTSATIPVDWRENDFKVSIGVVLSGGATLTYSVQHTFDDIQDASITPTWFDNDTLTSETATNDGNLSFPVRAVRLNVTSYTSGDATMAILQAGGRS
jgi:hypothetical protein